MARTHALFLVLLACVASVVASAYPPTYCKCTCFSNSTIIPLGPHKEAPVAPSVPATTNTSPAVSRPTPAPSTRSRAPSASADAPSPLARRVGPASCTQCNRAFCLDYNLPICKGAEEKDVATSCFQRDSRKDQIIVWAFILGTAGLLGWAGLKRALERRGTGKGLAAALAGSGYGHGRVAGGGGGGGGGAGPVGRPGARSGSPGRGGLFRRSAERGDQAARGVYGPLDGATES
ncbi:hypothetical protein P8C59_009379 [Phyllachora maydis]|uniref:Uncharacterized protein n=1 Tax=Phyllachora maydis TaxID=1825666 RepID=A0AAD9IDK7_9PEZI|nr:hypothetical protein P8C59_009379 [Phyllachora maydis]